MPYKASDKVKHIEATFESINIDKLGLPNTRYLNTKELSEEEQRDRSLDFLGGFELIDKEMRMYVFEGLGGEGSAMHHMYKANERQHTNDGRFKMIYNPDIKFKNRLYQEFDCAIKKIKLRDTLSYLIGESDIYLRSKVPQDMYEILQQFAEIRKQDRQNLVTEFNLYPSAERLLILERKYGDSLSVFDLTGKMPRRRKQKQRDGTASGMDERSAGLSYETQTIEGTTVMNTTSHAPSEIRRTAEESSSEEDTEPHEKMKLKADTDCHNYEFSRQIRERQLSQSMDFTRYNVDEIRNRKVKKLP